ncbi:MAG: DUF962 domain-containing protein [Dongiaceae bacterium]
MTKLRGGFQMSFSEFWPHYLRAHQRPGTRACHYMASVLGMSSSLAAAVIGEVLFAVGGIAGAYCLAIGSHWFIEHNKPLIAVNPLYGAMADVKMCWLAATGGLRREFIRVGLEQAMRPAKALVKPKAV